MSIADELEKLNSLKAKGAISEDEYLKAKESLLKQIPSGGEKDGQKVAKVFDVNSWAMFVHLSLFCGYLIPLAGMVVPIVLWQVKKNESEIIDQHGKNVTNWILSELIYGIVFFILCFLLIGIPLLIALGAVGIIFPIIGAVKAYNGEVWSYPLTIKFFK
jgi:uncharacterized Tic20 family protein